MTEIDIGVTDSSGNLVCKDYSGSEADQLVGGGKEGGGREGVGQTDKSGNMKVVVSGGTILD